MATLFHRNAQTAVQHHGGGSLVLGGVLAGLLFTTYIVFLISIQGDWVPLIIGVAFSLSAVLFGMVYHFTH